MDSNSNSRPSFKYAPMPIQEAQGDLCFRKKGKLNQSLIRHVVKHVLDNHQEKWHKRLPCGLALIDLMRDFISETLDSTKAERACFSYRFEDDEIRKLWENPKFRQLCEEYQRYASNCLNEACLESRDHIHYDTGDSDWDRCQQIELRSLGNKICIIAESSVRNGELGPYYLKTAYLYAIEEMERLREFVQDRQERLRSRQKNPQILAIHDKLPNGDKNHD